MKAIHVKEIMIPIGDYITVTKEDNLVDVLQALEKARTSKDEHAHRDAIVVDDKGNFVGKVTMIDIFRALEPNYKKVEKEQTRGVLTNEFVRKMVGEFRIWMEPEQSICERGSKKRVADVMHIPERTEYIDETDTLEKAMALYVMDVHQPLIVKKEDEVTGVLRFGDVFEVIRQSLLSCAC